MLFTFARQESRISPGSTAKPVAFCVSDVFGGVFTVISPSDTPPALVQMQFGHLWKGFVY